MIKFKSPEPRYELVTLLTDNPPCVGRVATETVLATSHSWTALLNDYFWARAADFVGDQVVQKTVIRVIGTTDEIDFDTCVRQAVRCNKWRFLIDKHVWRAIETELGTRRGSNTNDSND